MLEALAERGFDILTRSHGAAILAQDFPQETAALVEALLGFQVSMAELIGGGGGESGQTQRLRRSLSAIGWGKHSFTVETVVDGRARAGVSHEVDHVCFGAAGTLALEIEWNNKDPFFDRDLENFQRLHGIGAISLGVIVTRGRSLQDGMLGRVMAWMEAQGLESEGDLARLGLSDRTAAQRDAVARGVAKGQPFAEAFARKFVSDKFGPATTHWAKLEDRVNRGVGNPCPLLLIGLPEGILTEAPTVGGPDEPDLFGT